MSSKPPPKTLTSHIAHQILAPDIVVYETEAIRTRPNIQSRIGGIAHIANLLETNTNNDNTKLLDHKGPNTVHPQSLSSPSPQTNLHIQNLVLPTRLATFLSFTSHYDPQYSTNFYYACSDLAFLQSISLPPSSPETEDKIQEWLEEQVPDIKFDGLRDMTRERYLRILLQTAVGSIQVGLLIGVGILRGALGGFEKEGGDGGEDGGKSGDRRRIEEWVVEGEMFVDELERLKAAIEKRYSDHSSENGREVETAKDEQKDEEYMRDFGEECEASFSVVLDGFDAAPPVSKKESEEAVTNGGPKHFAEMDDRSGWESVEDIYLKRG